MTPPVEAQTSSGRASVGAFAAASIYACVFAASLIPLCINGACGNSTMSVDVSLWLYWLSAAALWLILGAAAWTLHRRAPVAIPRAATASGRIVTIAAILGVALGVRLLVVLTTTPQLSDDMYRYVHDGKTLARGQNPYAAAPHDVQGKAHIDARLIERINYADLVTIYQPTSQAVFAGVAALQPSWDDPFGHTSFRLAFVLLDLLIIVALLRRLAVEHRSPWWVTLYAWHPLAVSEVAGSGHQDVIGILLLVVTLLMLTPSAAYVSWPRVVLGAACFAAAIAVKPVVLPLAMPIAWSVRRQPWSVGLGVCVAATVLVGLYVPFLFMEDGIQGLFDTVKRFVAVWDHNSSAHALLSEYGGRQMASSVCAGLLGAALMAAMVAGCDVWRVVMVYMFAAILLTTTAHPWYVLWALALVPLRFSAALWALSLTITWSYVAWRDVDAWQVPTWVRVMIYAPVYGLIVVELVRWWLRREKRPGQQTLVANGAAGF